MLARPESVRRYGLGTSSRPTTACEQLSLCRTRLRAPWRRFARIITPPQLRTAVPHRTMSSESQPCPRPPAGKPVVDLHPTPNSSSQSKEPRKQKQAQQQPSQPKLAAPQQPLVQWLDVQLGALVAPATAALPPTGETIAPSTGSAADASTSTSDKRTDRDQHWMSPSFRVVSYNVLAQHLIRVRSLLSWLCFVGRGLRG